MSPAPEGGSKPGRRMLWAVARLVLAQRGNRGYYDSSRSPMRVLEECTAWASIEPHWPDA